MSSHACTQVTCLRALARTHLRCAHARTHTCTQSMVENGMGWYDQGRQCPVQAPHQCRPRRRPSRLAIARLRHLRLVPRRCRRWRHQPPHRRQCKRRRQRRFRPPTRPPHRPPPRHPRHHLRRPQHHHPRLCRRPLKARRPHLPRHLRRRRRRHQSRHFHRRCLPHRP